MPRRLLNILVAIVSLIWAVLFTWTEIIDADPDTYSVNSPEFKQELANCAGNFAQRQACAERLAEANQQLGFLVWLEKAAIILGPPLVLWGLLAYSTRNAEGSEGETEPGSRPRQEGTLGLGPRRVGPQRRGFAQSPGPLSPEHDAQGGGAMPGEPPMDGMGGRGSAPGHRGDEPVPPHPPIFSGGRREPIRRRDR